MAAKPRLTLTLPEDINDFLDDLKSDFGDSDLSEDVSGSGKKIAAEVKTVTEIMFLIKFLPMMAIQVTGLK